MGWRGLLAGALALAMLEVLTSNASAAGSVGGILSGIGDLARRFLSPGVPAFAKPAPAPSSSSAQPAIGIPQGHGPLYPPSGPGGVYPPAGAGVQPVAYT
jgi:hypothetical protein